VHVSALGALAIMRYTNLLTYLLTYRQTDGRTELPWISCVKSMN